MAITTEEARQEINEELAAAIAQLEAAVGGLGEAFELLAVGAAERLEDEVYRPAQRAFGRAKRTQVQFAQRFGMAAAQAESPSLGPASQGARAIIQGAVAAAIEADRILSELQDSMKPVEFGDAELRTGIAEAREHLAALPRAAATFLRGLGR